MKALICSLISILCIQISIASPLNDEQREKLSKLNFRSLPAPYQQALLEVRATAEGRDEANTYCCKNGNPARMKVVTTTFVRWEPTGTTQAVALGQENCGFGGWSKCSIYGIQHVPTSYIDYGHEIVPDVDNSQCPENHIVCCKSMVPVAGFCMTIPDFNRLAQQWTTLQASHPEASLADLVVTLQNNGLPSLNAS